MSDGSVFVDELNVALAHADFALEPDPGLAAEE